MKIGTQMARIKFARDYFLVILNVITALSMLTLALESVGIELNVQFFVLIIFSALVIFWFVGYYLDTRGVVKDDYAKMLENTARGQIIIWKQIWKEVMKNDLEKMKNA